MGFGDILRALSAQVFGVTRRDWRTRPGRGFRRALRIASGFAQRHDLAERVADARRLLRKRIEGAAVSTYQRSVLESAQAEEVRTRTALAQRTADVEVERRSLENERVRSEIARNRAESRRNEAEAIARFTETMVRNGMIVAMRGSRIDVVPHQGLLDVERVRSSLDGQLEGAESPRD